MNKFSILAIALLALIANSGSCATDEKLTVDCQCVTTDIPENNDIIGGELLTHYCKKADTKNGVKTAHPTTPCGKVLAAERVCLCGTKYYPTLTAKQFCNAEATKSGDVVLEECRGAITTSDKDAVANCYCKGAETTTELKATNLKEDEYCIGTHLKQAKACSAVAATEKEPNCDCVEDGTLSTLEIGDKCEEKAVVKKPTSEAAAYSAAIVGAAVVNLLL